MKRAYIYILLLVWTALTVPWFFTEIRSEAILGFPPWAFYSFVMTIGYAILIASVIQFWWPLLAGEEDARDGENE
ncbi:MAG: hypothetical protein QF437_01910 [Planctomycetota bacterium]|jgi:hypothetical protein|nr:hypothetical protein [Planctomycetota bacterium]